MTSILCLASIFLRDPSEIASRLSPIFASSTDYRDLAPISRAIGTARIVQLGEQTHGDGTSFEVKVRLVKFLHEKHGFDVLVWESNLMECELMNDGLRSNAPIADIAGSAVFGHWSGAKESIGIFEYAQKSLSSPRPLRLSGFDIQSSGTQGASTLLLLVNQLKQVPGIVGGDPIFRKSDELRQMKSGAEKESACLEFSVEVHRLFKKNRGRIRSSLGATQANEIEHILNGFLKYREMMSLYVRYQKSQKFEDMKQSYDLRELANAKNVMWLANKKYNGKKLIIWAHNAHVSHLGSNGTMSNGNRSVSGLDSTGRFLKKELGSQLYTIGFVASGGSWSWMGNPPIPFVEAENGSLEELLGRAGFELGFIDLAPARRDKSDLLNLPISGYMNRQNGELGSLVWPKVFDGLVYIRDMKPRTPL